MATALILIVGIGFVVAPIIQRISYRDYLASVIVTVIHIDEVKMTRSMVDGEARSTPSHNAKAERDLRARRATTFWAGL